MAYRRKSFSKRSFKRTARRQKRLNRVPRGGYSL